MNWKIQNRTHDLSRRGWIMGVLNVTPDSFSDGGDFARHEAALQHARRMIAEGADVIDIGGESTRPGAAVVSVEEEMQRVLPVIEALRKECDTLISIDTSKPKVAREAVSAGANIINDVTGFRSGEMLEVIRATGVGAICMHMLGTPANMQKSPIYRDVVAEVRKFFVERLATCIHQGIDPETLAFDPGIGFGKTVAHNLALLRNPALLRVAARPIIIGVSRKSFLGKIISNEHPEERLWPTIALTARLRESGVDVFRVHDVRENLHALKMMEAIRG